MKLHELKASAGARKAVTRKGRGAGSGNGKTAGFGHKVYLCILCKQMSAEIFLLPKRSLSEMCRRASLMWYPKIKTLSMQ